MPYTKPASDMESTEEPQKPTEAQKEEIVEEVKISKKPRSEKQKQQFDAARSKALEMRKKAQQERAELATKAVVQAYSEGKLDRKETEENQENQQPNTAKPRKKAIRRRIMVVEQTSSESEADSEVEIILPPKKKAQQPEDDGLSVYMNKMFAL